MIIARALSRFGLVAVVLTVRAEAQQGARYEPTAGLKEWRVSPSGAARMDLVTGDSPTSMNAFRIRYPAGMPTDTGSHYHLGTEHIVILRGTLYFAYGSEVDVSKAKPYGPGDFIEIPAGTPHFEWMVGEVEAHVTHIGPLTTIWLSHRSSVRRPP